MKFCDSRDLFIIGLIVDWGDWFDGVDWDDWFDQVDWADWIESADRSDWETLLKCPGMLSDSAEEWLMVFDNKKQKYIYIYWYICFLFLIYIYIYLLCLYFWNICNN